MAHHMLKVTVRDWSRDVPTYRWRIHDRQPRDPSVPYVDELVFEFGRLGAEIYLTHLPRPESQPWILPVRAEVLSDSKHWVFYEGRAQQESEGAPHEEPFSTFGLVLRALAERDMRGEAERLAIETVFWEVMVKDRYGWRLLADYLPELRAWYDKEIIQFWPHLANKEAQPQP